MFTMPSSWYDWNTFENYVKPQSIHPSIHPSIRVALAQWLAHWPCSPRVAGSIVRSSSLSEWDYKPRPHLHDLVVSGTLKHHHHPSIHRFLLRLSVTFCFWPCTKICSQRKWAPSSEFVSSSIPSWQILTAHAQPFRGARDMAFCLKVPLDSLLVLVSSEGSGETARMRRLAWTVAARIADKYQIRWTRSKYHWATSQENLSSEICDQIRLKPSS